VEEAEVLVMSPIIAVKTSPSPRMKLEAVGTISVVVVVATVEDATRFVEATAVVEVPKLNTRDGENEPLFLT